MAEYREYSDREDPDFLLYGCTRSLSNYQISCLDPSASMQLDTVGMQPHSREYLERDSTCIRSARKFEMIDGQVIDYPAGIQFSGRP